MDTQTIMPDRLTGKSGDFESPNLGSNPSPAAKCSCNWRWKSKKSCFQCDDKFLMETVKRLTKSNIGKIHYNEGIDFEEVIGWAIFDSLKIRKNFDTTKSKVSFLIYLSTVLRQRIIDRIRSPHSGIFNLPRGRKSSGGQLTFLHGLDPDFLIDEQMFLEEFLLSIGFDKSFNKRHGEKVKNLFNGYLDFPGNNIEIAQHLGVTQGRINQMNKLIRDHFEEAKIYKRSIMKFLSLN